MEYLQYLVLIGIYMMCELKFDEEARAMISNKDVGTKVIHSKWQLFMRGIFICGILWATEPEYHEALPVFLTYTLFYWLFFDSIYAMAVLKQKPWYLGTTSDIDSKFPKWSHVPVWALKIVGLGASIYWVINLT